MTNLNDIAFASEDHKDCYERMLDNLAKGSSRYTAVALPLGHKSGDFAWTEHEWTSEQVLAWQQHKTVPLDLEDVDMHKRFVPTVAFVPKEYSIRDGDLYSRITKTMFDPLEQACDAPTIFFSLGEAGYIRIPRYMLTFTEEQKKAYRDASVADEDAPMVGAALQN